MREIGVLEARTGFSALLSEVEATGEAVRIMRHGRPVARLIKDGDPLEPRRKLSGAELSDRFKALRDAQPANPAFDSLSWDELKARIRE